MSLEQFERELGREHTFATRRLLQPPSEIGV